MQASVRIHVGMDFVAALGVIVAAACSEEAAPTSVKADAARAPAAPSLVDRLHPEERQFRDLAQDVPNHGAYYFDTESGNLVLYLTNLDDAKSAVGLVRSRLAHELSEAHRRHPQADISVRQATYTWLQLKEWRDQLFPKILAIRGVVWLDLDEARNRVVIGVESTRDPSLVNETLARLGVPRNAVELEESGPLQVEAGTLRDSVRPYLGGVQVQTLLACDLNGCSGKEGTLGFNAVWNSKKALVTSAHLSKMQGVTDSTRVFQPAFAQDTALARIGVEIADTSIGCGGGSCSPADAAVYQALDTTGWVLGRIARTVTACYGNGCDPATDSRL